MDNNIEAGKDCREDEDRRANLWDSQVETAGLQSGSTGNDSWGHCCESNLNDGAVQHPDCYMVNIKVYIRR